LDEAGNAVHGPSVKPDDDLWLEYWIWAEGNDGVTPVAADVKRKVTMRNEISAAANKIFPNGANKVPDQYKQILEQYDPAWTNVYSDGTPGTRIWTEGIWYDLGNVGAGFDNDGDLVPDKNAWMQPVGDPSIFDPASFRLVQTYAMVVVKLKGGGETVYNVKDQLYFENIPENNGAVGLVRYEFLPLKSGSSSALTPYQEVASGFDNEKFNGDYGASIGSGIASGSSKVEVDKQGNVTVIPGDTIDYTLSFTNAGDVAVGDPKLRSPLVIVDIIPTGTTYVAGSATSNNVLSTGSYTVLFSTNNGASWTDVEPLASDITDIQWWLSDTFGTNDFGSVGFTVDVDNPYTNDLPFIENEGGGTFGGGSPFTNSTVITKVQGTNEIGDTVFLDDGAGGGVLGNGEQDGGEAGIQDITVWLYYDGNTNGIVDTYDALIGSDTTDVNGNYLFSELYDGQYIAVVNAVDPDLPFGTAVTLPTKVVADVDSARTNSAQVSFLDADFAFAPVLSLNKSIVGGVTTNREGDTISYLLTVTNSLEGDGGLQTYTVWAEDEIPASKPWPASTNAYIPPGPDGVTSSNALEAADETISLVDFNVGATEGSISNVKLVIVMDITGTFNGDDNVEIQIVERGGPTVFTTNIVANFAATNLPAIIVDGELVLEATTNRVWQWSDFNDTNIIIQLVANKAGGPNSGYVLLDAAGFRITSDWVGGNSNPSLSLNPVPLIDTFDASMLSFSSADVWPSSVTTNGSVGTVTWNNVGPLYEGAYQEITLDFDVLEPPNNTTANATNIAAITNAYYGDGRPANTVTDEVASVILPAGTIGDYVWRDLDGDGVQDGGNEVGIAGVSVILTPPGGVDLGNGAGNPITNVTDADGLYLFTGIPADGNYTILVDTNTLPGGSGTPTWDADGGNDNTSVIFIDHDSTTGLDTSLTNDFGYTVFTTLDGTVWNDVDRSGTTSPDSGEPWLTNVTVYLYAGTTPGTPATAIATNYTDANGYFRFVGNYVGDYTVQVWTNTGEMAVGDWIQSFDTDGTGTADYVPLNVVSGGTARADFSYYETGTYNIGDRVFYDWDGDGLLTAADEGITNITVNLYEDENSNGVIDVDIDALVATDVTDTGGGYLFSSLPSANYLVIVDQDSEDFPESYVNTADPYGINDGRSLLYLDATKLDQDFGYQPTGSGSIGDTVWYDKNGDGAQAGPLETGLESISVTLKADFNGDGTYVTVTSMVTDASGYYLFEGLPDGYYVVTVDENDSDLPSDAFGQKYILSTSQGLDVTITDGNSYLDADFGFTALGAIGDTIFWDANKNGTQDYNEEGIANVTVRLYIDVNDDGLYTAGTDTLYATDITDVDGKYLFTGLPMDQYVVDVVESGPIATATIMADPDADGLPATDPEAVGVDGETAVTIYAGTSFMGADFGYVPPGVIGDTLWLDTNGDGILDANELGLSYITIELLTNGVVAATNETDSSGQYLFQNLDDGTYVVRVATNDADWSSNLGQTYDPDAVLDDQASAIIISNGVVVSIGGSSVTNADLDIDFGYRYTGTNLLSGTIGLESTPIDGVIGTGTSGYTASNEVPYSDASVYLYLWNDNGNDVIDPGESELVSSAVTDANGDYTFTDIPEGDGNDAYIVSISAPEDFINLTTTTGDTPATNVVDTLDPAGYTASAYQVVPVAPVITGMDFAFQSAVQWDFGDLPSIYSTLIQDTPTGPRHKVMGTPNLYLGSTVDTESNGQPSAGADGDGADEDGVVPLGVWQDQGNGWVEVTVGAGEGWIVGYVDLNNDGDFTDIGELVISQAASTNTSGAGIYTNAFAINTNAMSGTNATSLYARFRLLPDEPVFPEFDYVGQADNGEVEDYLWQFGVLGDYVWRDTDADGVQDVTEDPITNARVFVDINADGIYQASEPSGVTDTNGFYYIGGFSPGTYTVLVDTNTIPQYVWPSYDLDGTGTEHTASVTMTNGQVRYDVDFGYQPLVLGGMVWLDSDKDGLQNETNMLGITNITVHLLDSSTNLVSTTVTDTNGTYLFDVDMPGDYFIQFFPITYEVSPQNVGGDEDIDSDAATNSPYVTDSISLAVGDRQFNWDMGVYLPSITNTIGDRVWFDYDQDGIQDPGEEGVSGLTITLYDNSTNVVETTVTDIAGNYYFTGIDLGNYFIGFSKPANYVFSTMDAGGDDSLDSDADTVTGFSPTYYITNGFLDVSIDAGIYGIVDVGVDKTVDDAGPNIGQIIEFTLVVSNSGPAIATEVELTDTWPTNLTYIGAAPSQGTFDSSSNFWNLGQLLVDQFETLVITGQVVAGTGGESITNFIQVTNIREPDSNSANDSDDAILTVESVDVGVTKTVSDSAPQEGDAIEYTIVVTNNGPDAASGVELFEPLTNYITYSSHVVSTGFYSGVTNIWYIGPLGVGEFETLTITADVDAGAGGRSITNIATITSIDQEDTNPTNNVDDAVINVVGADLGVNKTVDNEGPNENDTIFYTITITNNGPNVPTNIVVSEPLANGLNYVGHLASGATTYSTNDYNWNIPILGVGSNETLVVECTVGGGTKFTYITNISTIVTSSLPDPVTVNNSDDQLIGVADIAIKKTSSIPTNGWVYPGSNITYTITVTNQGVPPHWNVSITDELPGGVSYVPDSMQIFRPFYTNESVIDNFDIIAYTNSDGAIPWANGWQEIGEANGTSAGDVRVLDDTGVGSQYVLSIENGPNGAYRSADVSAWRWGMLYLDYRRFGMDNDTNDYVTVSISSNGVNWVTLDTIVGTGIDDPSYVSTNYDVTDYLSASTTIRFLGGPSLDNNDYLYIDNVNLSVTSRVYRTMATNPPPNLTTNLLLYEDEYCELTYDVQVDAAPAYLFITNTAKVTSSLMPLPRKSTVVDPVYYVDLGVLKDVNYTTLVGSNEVIWYTIDLTNSGPGDATAVQLTDYWPTNVIYSNAIYSVGYYNPTNHTWSGFNLASGAVASLVITGQVDNVPLNTVITNVIEVTGLNEYDPNPENDKDDTDFDTLVVLSGFDAYVDGRDVVLEWKTSSEYDTAGFYVLRVMPDGSRERVNDRMVPALAGYPQGGTYSIIDPNGRRSGESEYVVLEKETDGKEIYYGPYKVRPKRASGKSSAIGAEGYAKQYTVDLRAKERARERKMSISRSAARRLGGLSVEAADGIELTMTDVRKLKKVWRVILRAWDRPADAEGSATFIIRLGKHGKLTRRDMVISSGDAELDSSAAAALGRVRFIQGLDAEFIDKVRELKVTFGTE
ncbi:hypothetical protein BVX97_04360, partial [bacterium E08(2017)]